MSLPDPISDIDPAPATVRKPIDFDCLLNDELHPSVVDRLQRIRDLPVTNVANLYGVERDAEGSIWLLWQYLEGQTLDVYLAEPKPAAEVERLKQQLTMIVEAMHSHGIIHGAIHANNVIVDSDRRVQLTHISPLLYTEPQGDLEAIDELFEQYMLPGTADSARQPVDDLHDLGFRVRGYIAVILSVIAGVVIFRAILWYIRA